MDAHAPRVSVVLATYNGEGYLSAQLDSIACQSHRPDELIVGDDGSKDGTLALLEDWAAAHGDGLSVRILRQPQRLGSTKNFAALLAESRGEFVFFSDQDDVWRPDRVARCLEVLEHSAAGFVFSDARIIDGDGRPTGESLWGSVFFSPAEQALVRAGRALEVLLRHNVVTGATMAVRKEVLPWVLPIAGHWVHDGWIALVVAAVAGGVAIADPLVDYRRHHTQQIGAIGLHFGRLRRFIAAQDAASLLREAEDYQLAAARLRTLAATHGAGLAAAAERVEEKAAFLATRARLRAAGRARRLWHALAPEGARQYRQFSLGPKTLAVDIVAPRSRP